MTLPWPGGNTHRTVVDGAVTVQLDMATVVVKAIEMASPLLETRRHRLTTDLPGSPLWVEGDDHRLAVPWSRWHIILARASERDIWGITDIRLMWAKDQFTDPAKCDQIVAKLPNIYYDSGNIISSGNN